MYGFLSASAFHIAGEPFATVNSVAEGSPASQAGLQPGDRIVAFGSVDATTAPGLEGLVRVTNENEGVRDRP